MAELRFKGLNIQCQETFSSAAFPIAAALVTNSELTIYPIDMDDPQGDKLVIQTLIDMGAKIHYDAASKCLHVDKGCALVGAKINLDQFIDAITILAVIGCYASGQTELYNGKIARKKECDRIACIVKELKKMGADIEETEDGLIVRQSKLCGAKLSTHKDHRMALSLSVAALGASSKSQILDADVIQKTYPTFFKDLKDLGANIEKLS